MNKLRVWWIPQVPGERFFVDVASVAEAKKMLNVLARYDAFQLEHNIKPDYSNVGGLEELVDGEWCEWSDDNGLDIDDVARLEAAKVEANRVAEAARSLQADSRRDVKRNYRRSQRTAARSRA